MFQILHQLKLQMQAWSHQWLPILHHLSQIIYFEDPHQGLETRFESHMWSDLSKKITKCSVNYHKTITQFDGLLVSSYGPLHNPKTGKD